MPKEKFTFVFLYHIAQQWITCSIYPLIISKALLEFSAIHSLWGLHRRYMTVLVSYNDMQALFFPWLLQNEFFFHHKPEEPSNDQLTKNSAPTGGLFFTARIQLFVTKPIPAIWRELLLTMIQSLHNLSTIVLFIASKSFDSLRKKTFSANSKFF